MEKTLWQIQAENSKFDEHARIKSQFDTQPSKMHAPVPHKNPYVHAKEDDPTADWSGMAPVPNRKKVVPGAAAQHTHLHQTEHGFMPAPFAQSHEADHQGMRKQYERSGSSGSTRSSCEDNGINPRDPRLAVAGTGSDHWKSSYQAQCSKEATDSSQYKEGAVKNSTRKKPVVPIYEQHLQMGGGQQMQTPHNGASQTNLGMDRGRANVSSRTGGGYGRGNQSMLAGIGGRLASNNIDLAKPYASGYGQPNGRKDMLVENYHKAPPGYTGKRL